MPTKLTKKQQVIRFVVYLSVALLALFSLDSFGIKLNFWQQLFFVALPLLVVMDLLIGLMIKNKSK